MFSSLRGWLSTGNRGGVGKRGRRGVRETRRWARRQQLFERLEPRVVLNADLVAKDDPCRCLIELRLRCEANKGLRRSITGQCPPRSPCALSEARTFQKQIGTTAQLAA